MKNTLFLLAVILFFYGCTKTDSFTENFDRYNNRTWISESFWPIPLEEWQISNGRIECIGTIRNMRVNLLDRLIEGDGNFQLSVEMGVTNQYTEHSDAGVRLAVKDKTDSDIRSVCYFGTGTDIGVSTTSNLFINDESVELPEGMNLNQLTLVITGTSANGTNKIHVSCTDDSGKLAEIEKDGFADFNGMISFVQNFSKGGKYTDNHPKFYFDNIKLEGSNIIEKPENSFGPILFSMYTLSNNHLKLTAQMPPLGEEDAKAVALQIKKNDSWETIQTAEIERDACIAPFSVTDWDSEVETEYRIAYSETYRDNSTKEFYYEGVIRKEPTGKELSLGGLTCQYHYGFPYQPLVENLTKSNPDVLYFSGDQIYEANGGYGIVRNQADKAILNYLGKWYMFGWAFGEVMKERPTVCIADDHEVYQGNLWGDGGKKISVDQWNSNPDCQTGFVQPIEMVNVVMRTNSSHLPDPYDPTPMENDILVYYTNMVYGGVDFAIVGDRLFKSGPEKVSWWNGRKDHLKEPLDDPSKLSKPGLKFLGDRQMEFLEHWADDWDGEQIKVLLSQTPFAYSTTHHGPNRMLLYGDLDSGGWPKQPRDSAIALMNRCKAFHITGDQHITNMVQYGINEFQDAGWVFCTPAVAVGYPRRFFPDTLGWEVTNRPDHGLPNTGQYTDGFGNKNYIYAVGNPDDNDKNSNRYQLAEQKASGYGMVYFDKENRNVKCESIRFLGDVEDIQNAQFPGWPVTINLDNQEVIE